MSVQDTRNKPDEMGTSAALLDETCAVIVSFQKCENPLSRGNCFDVSIQKGDEPSSDNVCAQCSAGGDDIARHCVATPRMRQVLEQGCISVHEETPQHQQEARVRRFSNSVMRYAKQFHPAFAVQRVHCGN
jgi:hypothetical protein